MKKKRLTLFGLGTFILALGVTLNAEAGLGISAVTFLPYVFGQLIGLSLGMSSVAFYILLIALQLVMEPKMSIKLAGQLPFSFIFGLLVDFYADLIPTSDKMAEQLVVLFLGILLTSLGAYLLVASNVVLNPADGFVNCLGRKLNKEFGQVKSAFDPILVCLGLILAYTITGELLGFGLGTFLAALLNGRMISVWRKILGPRLGIN